MRYKTEDNNAEQSVKVRTLWENNKRLLLGIAMKILGDSYLAEDAVQTAFIRITGNIDKIEDVDSDEAKSYAAIAVRREAIKMSNKRKKLLEDVNYDDCEKALSDNNSNPENIVISSESVQNITNLVMSLPDTYQDALVLHLSRNFSYKDIARTLDISESAASKRITRAKGMLKKMLAEEGIV